eukprot:364091-Chlamydomonas_euryale.AAC.8
MIPLASNAPSRSPCRCLQASREPRTAPGTVASRPLESQLQDVRGALASSPVLVRGHEGVEERAELAAQPSRRWGSARSCSTRQVTAAAACADPAAHALAAAAAAAAAALPAAACEGAAEQRNERLPAVLLGRLRWQRGL